MRLCGLRLGRGGVGGQRFVLCCRSLQDRRVLIDVGAEGSDLVVRVADGLGHHRELGRQPGRGPEARHSPRSRGEHAHRAQPVGMPVEAVARGRNLPCFGGEHPGHHVVQPEHGLDPADLLTVTARIGAGPAAVPTVVGECRCQHPPGNNHLVGTLSEALSVVRIPHPGAVLHRLDGLLPCGQDRRVRRANRTGARRRREEVGGLLAEIDHLVAELSDPGGTLGPVLVVLDEVFAEIGHIPRQPHAQYPLRRNRDYQRIRPGQRTNFAAVKALG